MNEVATQNVDMNNKKQLDDQQDLKDLDLDFEDDDPNDQQRLRNILMQNNISMLEDDLEELTTQSTDELHSSIEPPIVATNDKILCTLRESLALNRQYKELLHEQLAKIEIAQKQNAAIQRKLRLFLSQKTGKFSNTKKYAAVLQKRTADQFFFVDENGSVSNPQLTVVNLDNANHLQRPPENIDTIKKKRMSEKMPLVYKTKKWTPAEIESLRKGVLQQNQEIRVTQIMKKYQSNKEPGSLDKLKKEIEDVSNLPEEELLRDVSRINWDVLAQMHVPTRDGMSCKLQWENELSPSLNKSKWTKKEDKRLLELAQQYKGHNWAEIAKALGTSRNALHCFRRYQRSLNVNMLRSKWTKEEDRKLTEAVAQYGERNWQQVANCLEGRTGQQCLHRWMKTLNPKIRRGRWTEEEDKRLIMAVHAYQNNNWIKIQKHIPGRTDVQCRERWCNILNPALKNEPWTPEEDALLKKAIEEHGAGKWAKIAEILHPRTDNQCWRRWKVLNADKVEDYRKTILKKDKAMVRNFVGREKERPAITPDDLDIEIKEEQKRRRRASVRADKGTGQSSRSEREIRASPHITPFNWELQRKAFITFLKQKFPMFVGVPPTPFVNASLNMLKFMTAYRPSEQDKKDKPQFVTPCLDADANYGRLLPCIPATKQACFALATLYRLLVEDTQPKPNQPSQTVPPEHSTSKEDETVEDEEDLDEELDLEDTTLSDFEDDFVEGYKYNPHDFVGSLDIDKGKEVVPQKPKEVIDLTEQDKSTVEKPNETSSSQDQNDKQKDKAGESKQQDKPSKETPTATNDTSKEQNNKSQNQQSTDREKMATVSTQPSINVCRWEYLSPDIVKNEQFKLLISVFNALFSHSMLRVMTTTATIMPYLLRRSFPPVKNQRPIVPAPEPVNTTQRPIIPSIAPNPYIPISQLQAAAQAQEELAKLARQAHAAQQNGVVASLVQQIQETHASKEKTKQVTRVIETRSRTRAKQKMQEEAKGTKRKATQQNGTPKKRKKAH